jgi:hypothetical protein
LVFTVLSTTPTSSSLLFSLLIGTVSRFSVGKSRVLVTLDLDRTHSLLFPTENLETVPISKLNNSELLVGVVDKTVNTKLKPQQSYCADLDDEPILPTINVDIRNPIDKILEEEPLQSSPKLNFRFPDSESLLSSFNMVSPSKMNISKPSM